MRQVGDRLIPVGVTSGRIHPIGEGTSTAEGGPEGESSARRSRRRERAAAAAAGGGGELGQLLNQMGIGMGGQDLEEVSFRTATLERHLLDHKMMSRVIRTGYSPLRFLDPTSRSHEAIFARTRG